MPSFIKFLNNIFNPAPLLHIAYDIGDKHKQTIVLLHGIAATSKTWDYLIKDLDNDKYRIIALDLLGFGQSPKPSGHKYDADDHVESIYRTIKKLRIRKPFIIVGHSMGAIISAHYYSCYSSEISKMYLLSPPIYLDKDYSLSTISRKRTDLYLDAYKYILENKDFTITNSQLIRKLLLIKDGIDINENNWEGFRLSLMNTIIKQNTYNQIKGTKIPVHIIYGSMDELLIPESINKLDKFKVVKVTKLIAVDHVIGKRFAKEVAAIINKQK